MKVVLAVLFIYIYYTVYSGFVLWEWLPDGSKNSKDPLGVRRSHKPPLQYHTHEHGCM